MIAEALLGLALAIPADNNSHTIPEFSRYASESSERGWQPSAYRGKYFVKVDEPLRKCIGTRESHFQYMLSNGGAYQFMSGWKPISGAWMLKKEARQMFGDKAANRMFNDLSKRPFNQWSRYWQDALYSTVMNWEGRRSGWKHWAPTVPGTLCR